MYIFFFFFFFLSLLVHFKVVQRYTLQFVRQWWIECKINDSIRRCTAVAYASLATATSFFFYSSYSIVSLFLTAAYFFFSPESDNFIVSSTLSTKRVKKKKWKNISQSAWWIVYTYIKKRLMYFLCGKYCKQVVWNKNCFATVRIVSMCLIRSVQIYRKIFLSLFDCL